VPIFGAAIATIMLMAGVVVAIVGFTQPQPRRTNYCMGGLGLSVLGAALFVWSISMIGPY